MIDSEKHNQENCVAACAAAIAACQACAAADIRAGTMLCALINLDCADICTVTMNAVARGSPHHGDFCSVCAHICRACAAACEAHAAIHEHCAICLRACEHCAWECTKHAKERHC